MPESLPKVHPGSPGWLNMPLRGFWTPTGWPEASKTTKNCGMFCFYYVHTDALGRLRAFVLPPRLQNEPPRCQKDGKGQHRNICLGILFVFSGLDARWGPEGSPQPKMIKKRQTISYWTPKPPLQATGAHDNRTQTEQSRRTCFQ